MAACGKGTRCSRDAFIRSAGTVQFPVVISEFGSVVISNSFQVIPRTSPERAAVSVTNCKALAPAPSRLDKSFPPS